MSDEKVVSKQIGFIDLMPALEFACWTIIVLATCLRIINGAAVTTDQWWIQVFLFSGALSGACSLRLYQMLIRRDKS